MREKRKITLFTCILIAGLAFLIISLRIIGLNYSAESRGNDIYWDGHLYVECGDSEFGGEYHEGKTLARTSDGWDINEVEEDTSHIFIVKRSFLDNYLCVRVDY